MSFPVIGIILGRRALAILSLYLHRTDEKEVIEKSHLMEWYDRIFLEVIETYTWT